MKGMRSFAIGTLLACVAVVGVAVPSGAQTTGTPFDDPNVFCKKTAPQPGTRNTAAPGVTPNSVTIGDDSLDVAQLKKLGIDTPDYHAFFVAFFDEVNKCGGINGRKVNFKTALYNPVAPDLVGHQQAECLKVTEDYKAFMLVGVTSNQIQRCVSVQHKTIYVAPAYITSDDFLDAKGRLVSNYPAGDKLSAMFVKDAKNNNTFKGHKVAVLAAAITTRPAAVQEQQQQYVDALKDIGVDAEFDVLPCTGTVCTASMGNVVRKMKSNGIDMVVLSHLMPGANVGPFWREMMNQGLKASMVGPDNNSLHSDTVMPAFVRAAGADGAAYAAQYGWRSTAFEIRGAWRTGQAKETPFAKMCIKTLATALNQRPYVFGETDINNGRYTGVTTVCRYARAVARAIYSAGPTLTTEKVVEILRNQKDIDQRDSTPLGIPNWVFTDKNFVPNRATDQEFKFPCPLPTRQAGTGCMMPSDTPARFRTVK